MAIYGYVLGRIFSSVSYNTIKASSNDETLSKNQVAPFPGYPEETPRFAPLKSPPGLECTEEVQHFDYINATLFRLI